MAHNLFLCETRSYLYYFYCTYVIYLHTLYFVPNKLLIVSSTLFETKATLEIQMNIFIHQLYSHLSTQPYSPVTLSNEVMDDYDIECNEVRMIMIVKLSQTLTLAANRMEFKLSLKCDWCGLQHTIANVLESPPREFRKRYVNYP